MKKGRKRAEEKFRGNNEERFYTCVALSALNIDEKRILRYAGINPQMWKKWGMVDLHEPEDDERKKAKQYKQLFEERKKEYQSKFPDPDSEAGEKLLKEIKVDCGIRHLLYKKSMPFLKEFVNFSPAESEKDAVRQDSKKDSVLLEIKNVAKKVDLDTDEFEAALCERLKLANRTQGS